MNSYEHNLSALKRLIDKYIIADLTTMIDKVPVLESGACCYPAVQTLISLMELLGKICRHDLEYDGAFEYILHRMGTAYQLPGLANKLYSLFRHGIAHNSLAKGGVFVNKTGDSAFHLSDNGNNLDIKIR